MGIIRNQSINNSINIYVGIIIGAINTILIFPYVFESNPEYWGLIQILISYSVIFSTFSHFGSPNILLRYFPKISNKTNLISFTFLLCLIGFLFFLFLFLFFQNSFLKFIDATQLLNDNFYLIGFLVFSISFYDLFSSISRSYLDSTTPVFLNEVFVRVCVFLLLILYNYDFILFDHFLYLFISIYIVKFLLFIYIQLKNNRLTFSLQFSKLDIKELLVYGFYVLTAGGSSILVSRFDLLMIEYYIDLKHVAFYTLAFFMGSVIRVPERSISFIASPLVAKSFEKKDYDNIQSIYSKSSINLLIIGGIIFLCVLLNIDDILNLLPDKFSKGKYVVLLIGITQLINLSGGLHNLILLHSPYFKSIVYFNFFLLLLTFLTNVIFIPIYGINGAALATFISVFTFNIARMLYVYKKMNFHPFSIKTLIVILTIVIIYFSIVNISFTSVPYVNILIRSLISCILVIFSVQYFNLSDDINSLIKDFRTNYFKI